MLWAHVQHVAPHCTWRWSLPAFSSLGSYFKMGEWFFGVGFRKETIYIVLGGIMCTWHKTAPCTPLLKHASATQSDQFIQYLCKKYLLKQFNNDQVKGSQWYEAMCVQPVKEAEQRWTLALYRTHLDLQKWALKLQNVTVAHLPTMPDLSVFKANVLACTNLENVSLLLRAQMCRKCFELNSRSRTKKLKRTSADWQLNS